MKMIHIIVVCIVEGITQQKVVYKRYNVYNRDRRRKARCKNMKTIALFLSLIFLTACGKPIEKGERQSVLIIGDSISRGYYPFVKEILERDFDVDVPPTNAKNSTFTKIYVDEWLSKKYDVITWNNGLWNCMEHISASQPVPLAYFYTDVHQYENDIIEIAKKLKATGARVIFFTTTYIPRSQGVLAVGQEVEQNEIAKRVLPPLGIEVIDLWERSYEMPNSMRDYGYDIHFTEDGSKVLADYVSRAILGNLE